MPGSDPEMLIEWTHRALALTVGVLALLVLYSAMRARLDGIWVVLPALGATVGVGVQAWIGRLVVEGDLARDLVALHLLVSMLVLALFVVVAVSSRSASRGPHMLDRDWTRQLVLGSVGVLMVVLLGALVHDIYVPGWPLINGEWIPDVSDLGATSIHWLHRMSTAIVFVYTLFLLWRAWRTSRPRSEGVLLVGAAFLYSVNIALGYLHVITEVSAPWLVAAHLGLGAMVWAAFVALTILSFQDPR